MLRDAVASPGERTPEQLRRAYDELLAETVRAVGTGAVADRAGVQAERLESLLDGESPSLTVAEATAILAADGDRPGADTLAAEARDILLMGMSIAVLDVETLASRIGGELDPKEIQQKVEGRQPMCLDEYALLHSHIEGRS